ncbi:succinate-semialdehyde dehydrogenase [Cupriavidus sp. HMR-1]|uniref:aldehyde dehydrogenase family protein n=1 Tax=Cupriavidus sp. HMR-1 TaxID=1249621 RepID=UPI0002A438B1|nr:aldehyde dehydrogenase family protein [Cupriavidus sp. HMR-1]EKZ98287.1 succinate-semialdehyde dehydrogenase [Cupriavidus sp. HMR-1]
MSTSRFPVDTLPPTGNLINGVWVDSTDHFDVLDKFTGHPIATMSAATREQVSQAVRIARMAVDAGPPAPHDRSVVLRGAAERLEAWRSRFVDAMTTEAGFTLVDANNEIDRAKITLNLCANESTQLTGEVVPFAASPGAHQRIGFTRRFPVGVVCAITPFNSPLNTVLHKVGPAYAAGNSVILKPSAFTPLTSALLGQVLLEAGMPAPFLSILQGEGETVGTWLLEEQDVAFYTFTGSTRVGRIIQRAAGLRRTQMELGSIASTFVAADADLDRAIPKIANAGLRKAGQVCTSVQRLYVDHRIADEVAQRLVEYARTLVAGDPRDPATRVGPLINEQAAIRAETWIGEAVAAGARVLCGGTRQRSVIEPTVITDVPDEGRVWCQEAFAPLIALRPFDDFDAALASANSTPFGLAAGIFTQDIDRAMKAAETLRFGTVQINETSSARSDVMPFGGVKDSGFGKEGPHYAMREMTEERLTVFNP